jgi:hypothetical protein
MLSKQEHINEALGLAEKGLYHKDRIKEVIKADFYKLSRKYGVSLQTIYNITNG